MATIGREELISAVNSAEKISLTVTILCQVSPDIKGEFSIADCGKSVAKENSVGFVVECDLPGGQNENADFVNFVNATTAFYVEQSQYLLTTTFRFVLDGEKVIIGTVYDLDVFPIFCSLRIVSTDAEFAER